MIVVVADDFTGAAEVAGMVAAAGVETQVQRGEFQPADARVVVLDTDSRSLPPREAYARLLEVGRRLKSADVVQVVKKIDSVLRGSIVAEIRGLMTGLGRMRALMTPANPARGRLVRDGRVEVQQIPLEQTLFADDPEYPAVTSHVLELLRRIPYRRSDPLLIPPDPAALIAEQHFVNEALQQLAVRCGSPQDRLPDLGLVVGNAESTDDLSAWCDRLDDGTLPVGAAEFCGQWLRRRLTLPSDFRPLLADSTSADTSESRVRDSVRTAFSREASAAGSVLLICGSPTAWKAGRGLQCETLGVPVFALSPLLVGGDPWLWVLEHERCRELRQRTPQVLLTCASEQDRYGDVNGVLVKMLARFAASVIGGESPPRWVLVEGGATAAALVQSLNLSQFRAMAPWAPGVVPLEPIPITGWTLVSKPGSYEWPDWVCR